MQRAIDSGQAYCTRLEPGPTDPAVAHKGDTYRSMNALTIDDGEKADRQRHIS